MVIRADLARMLSPAARWRAAGSATMGKRPLGSDREWIPNQPGSEGGGQT